MQSLFRWTRTSTPRCRELVLEALKSSHPTPLKTQELYQSILKDSADEKVSILPPFPEPHLRLTKVSKIPRKEIPPPPHPDHPIRSLKYLKSVVLEDLVARNEIEKVHSVREPTVEELKRAKEGASKKRKAVTNVRQVMINARGMVDQWAWSLKTSDKLAEEEKERLRIQKAVEGQKKLDTKQQEKEERNKFLGEWGHLNARRQRARVGKLRREDNWAKMLEDGRREGMTLVDQAADTKWKQDNLSSKS